ncbi:hypothetical protein PMO31116_00528 [Pandoraea morbifera]|uniref:DUF4852 domain-containing protein n=1 Tax=Pandoraea morbifera TaxID=2508300 RepID=A0A5E4S1S8_9BURK|nr:hypothetical protein [Pandoraea morbifera]VVD69540.1 hypothetical protein PMO31116_00528 [Pandoraea morbifera]
MILNRHLVVAAVLTLSALSAAAAPQPDLKTPLERYEPLQSGNQVMFQYYALSGVPLDYRTVAGYMSSDYRLTSDGFRQQDILNGLRPRIDAAFASAKANHYLRLDVDLSGSSRLSGYDFQKKGFTIDTVFDEGSTRFFSDNQHYQISFTNGTRYQFIPVPNEAAARAIETARSNRQNIALRVYAYANEVNSFNEQTKVVVTRVEFIGQGGKVLGSYSGALAPEVKKKETGIGASHGFF